VTHSGNAVSNSSISAPLLTAGLSLDIKGHAYRGYTCRGYTNRATHIGAMPTGLYMQGYTYRAIHAGLCIQGYTYKFVKYNY